MKLYIKQLASTAYKIVITSSSEDDGQESGPSFNQKIRESTYCDDTTFKQHPKKKERTSPSKLSASQQSQQDQATAALLAEVDNFNTGVEEQANDIRAMFLA